jgi:hypothetical protein
MAELTGPSTPMDAHSTDAIAVPVEITELTSSDEIAQWVGMNLNSDEEEEGTSRIQFRRRIKPMAQYVDTWTMARFFLKFFLSRCKCFILAPPLPSGYFT